MNEKYALYEISFTNALLYSRAVPIPGDDKSDNDNAPLYDDSKDACQDIDLSGVDEKLIAQSQT